MSRAIALLLVLFAMPADADEYTVYQFTATWCVPCQQMEPTIRQLEAEGKRVVKVDIDTNPQLTSRFRVNKVPTFLRVANGREVKRLVGVQSLVSLRTLFNPTKRDGPSAVVIVRSNSGMRGVRGTGCHIGQGYILTCEHVLRAGWLNSVETSDGRKYECEVVLKDAGNDISLLKVRSHFPVPHVKLTRYSPSVGTHARLYGMSGSFRAWDAEVVGYSGRKMRLKGKGTIMGDSGGPILVGENIVAIITTASQGWTVTSGPCAPELCDFIQRAGLKLYEVND